ncbi:Cytochrome 71D6 [Capsicum chinense]|nr:Cytochrome 71D6 [Capsicum chinense]
MSNPGRAGVVGVPHRWVKGSLVSLYGLGKSSPRELTFEVDANRFHLNQRKWKNSNSQTKKLPPGPWKFPFIGSMHLMVGGIPHRVFRELAQKYGLLMHFEVDEVSAIIATSAEVANQVPKTHDLAFVCRPKFMGIDIICYGSRDIAYIPYGEYWRQMRKICLMELLSAKNVRPFSSIRHDEVVLSLTLSDILHLLVIRLAQGFDVENIFPSFKFLHSLSGAKQKIIDMHHKVDAVVEDVINEHTKNLATNNSDDALGGEDLDMFGAVTDTTSVTITLAMAEMMKNPSILAKAQAEVREAFGDNVTFDKIGVEELKYLKLVVKETLRLLFRVYIAMKCLFEKEAMVNRKVYHFGIVMSVHSETTCLF